MLGLLLGVIYAQFAQQKRYVISKLGDGFNPFEKYESNWIISRGRDENKEDLKPPPSHHFIEILPRKPFEKPDETIISIT